MQPRHSGADCQAREAGFRDRSIHHPLRAEFLHETLADLEGALVVAHFLADQKNARVSTHLLPHGLVQRFPIGQSAWILLVFLHHVGVQVRWSWKRALIRESDGGCHDLADVLLKLGEIGLDA